MATYTANYGLHQWVPGDNFLRTDFNTDFQKIDAGIKAALSTAQGKPDIVTSSYTGDDAASRTINLGFQAKLILLEMQSGNRGGYSVGGLILPDSPIRHENSSTAAAQLTETGFQVGYIPQASVSTNFAGMTYHYLAVK